MSERILTFEAEKRTFCTVQIKVDSDNVQDVHKCFVDKCYDLFNSNKQQDGVYVKNDCEGWVDVYVAEVNDDSDIDMCELRQDISWAVKGLR